MKELLSLFLSIRHNFGFKHLKLQTSVDFKNPSELDWKKVLVIFQLKMNEERADTVPGFTMQSENFYLKFITGLQCGVSSKLLEYETDWYEVMEIILSRLQDEQENKERFELIASRDLEYWAKMQPGGDSLNLKIQVMLEEKRYFEPPAGSRKALRLIFNDRFSTQVLFHVRKKILLKSLREMSAVAVADLIHKEEVIENLEEEIPKLLIPEVRRAFHNCWTPRFFRTKVVRIPCPSSCICKNKSYVAQMTDVSRRAPDPEPAPVEEPPPQEQIPTTSSSSRSPRKKGGKQIPRKIVGRKSQRKKLNDKKKILKEKELDKSKVSTRSSCRISKRSSCKISTRSNCSCDKSSSSGKMGSKSKGNIDDSVLESGSRKVLGGLKVKIKQLHIEIESLVMKVGSRRSKRKAEEKIESQRRKSSRLISLKESLRELSRSRKRPAPKEDIFEPRPGTSKKSKISIDKSSKKSNSPKSPNKRQSKYFKRTLRSHVLEASFSRKKRRHS